MACRLNVAGVVSKDGYNYATGGKQMGAASYAQEITTITEEEAADLATYNIENQVMKFLRAAKGGGAGEALGTGAIIDLPQGQGAIAA